MFSLALWSVLALLLACDVARLAPSLSPGLPARAIAGYTWVVVVLNALAWLRPVWRATLSQEPSAILAGTGTTTNAVYVQDLGFWLPLMGVAGTWLWLRRRGASCSSGRG